MGGSAMRKYGQINRQVFAHNSRDGRKSKQPIPVKVIPAATRQGAARPVTKP